jgi:hypothetical protein
MRISQNPQGSIEWLAERKGVPTASEFAAFMVDQKSATARNALTKYLCGKLTDCMANDSFEQEAEDKASLFMDRDPWVQRGKYLEPIARKRLSEIIEAEIVDTGLCFHDSGEFAASPDGLVVGGDEWVAGCEIKCHNRKRHLLDVLTGTLPDDHKYQVHGCMVVTGLRQWHYFGFHPAQPHLHVVVEWDEFTDRLEAGLLAMADEKKCMKQILAAKWESAYRQPERIEA